MCAAVTLISAVSGVAQATADTFGTDVNQFTLDFVTISGDTNPASGISTDCGFIFTGVENDYRMGTYEITNDQWNKFSASLGVPVTGSASNAYNGNPSWTAANVATNNASWYEAAQFVNWLNTSTGHQAAYLFTGTQGTSDYTIANWTAAEADNGTNLYRHKDAVYFLPTENEWLKAGYWNGATLQAYATKAGESLHKGDGTSGTGWDYKYSTSVGPWVVGSGSMELNGTYDMMGSVLEWVESPTDGTTYIVDNNTAYRATRGGGYDDNDGFLSSANQDYKGPQYDRYDLGFRVAAKLPGTMPNGTQIPVPNGGSSESWSGNANAAAKEVEVKFNNIDTAANGELDFTAEATEIGEEQLAKLDAILDSLVEGEGGFVWVNWSFTLSRDLAGSESTDLIFDLGMTDIEAENVRLWHYDGENYTPINSALDFSQIDLGVFAAMGIIDFSDYTVTVTVPEPTTLCLLGFCVLSLLLIRRKRQAYF